MKVLFCSPYKQGEGYVQGGMATWGAHIVYYFEAIHNPDTELIPVSFDRKTYIVDKQTSMLRRAINGLSELGKPVVSAIKMMRSQHIDTVHICTSGSLGLLIVYILARFAKKYKARSIVHFHMGKIPEILKKKDWEKYLLVKVLNGVDVIMTMDTISFNFLKEKGYNNILNVPNPIAPSIVCMIDKQSKESIKSFKRVFFAGHVVKTKGVYELTEACSAIDNIELRIAGRCGEDVKKDLETIWGDNNGKLIFLGEVPHEIVIKEMLETTILSLPSYTEGFPNVILEAMACGCAIVATDVGAIAEMLNFNKPDKCGVCVKLKDSNSLREELVLLLNNSEIATKYGENAKTKVYADYTMEKIWDYLSYGWREYKSNKPISFI